MPYKNIYMSRMYRTLGLFLVALFSFQCQKELGYYGGPDTGAVVTPDPIKSNLQGNVVDENGQPAAGAMVTVGTETAITNSSGYFRVNNASLDKNSSLVMVEKAGYFKGYRVFAATSGTNQVVIKLVRKDLAATLTATSSGTATLAGGSKITLPAGSVVQASSGTAYTGDIKVYAAYINPAATDIGATIPGSFVADDKNGKRVTLASYGMLAVELESTTGEKLQIKQGAVATLSSPIPAPILSSAPATIALWYVDEQTGIWKEEGTATKQGNNYVGDVKHFSYWNYDVAFDAVTITATLKNAANLPLVNVPVRITADGVFTARSFTDSLGQVKGLVPANKNLALNVLDPCENSIYLKNISSLTESTDLGTITITSTGSSLVTFTGKLLNCSNAPVAKGYAMISFDNMMRYASTNANGEFSTTFVVCAGSAASARVTGIDEAAVQQSASATVNVTTPLTNAGSINACGVSSEQFVNYTLDGTDYSINSTTSDSIMGFSLAQGSTNVTSITANSPSPSINRISFTVNNAASTGTFPVVTFFTQRFNSVVIMRPFNVIFTKFPQAAGEFYEGTLTGRFMADSITTVHNVNASFKVRRTF